MTKTADKGDCCMLSVVEWGLSRLMNEEYPELFEDEDHMNYVGEFYFKVNETCLHGDHNIFMVAPNDRDAHNPILVHLNPSDMTWGEQRQYRPSQVRMRNHDKRKERQKANKRKAYEDQGNTGWGGSSSSTSRTWRTGYWR